MREVPLFNAQKCAFEENYIAPQVFSETTKLCKQD